VNSSRRATSRIQSFRYAFAGWWHVIRTQRNAWIHTIATSLVVVLGILLEVGRYDWALLVGAIGLVWLAEFLNTALEAVVDLASPEQNQLARIGKDVGAAAVLIAAGTSLVIGLLIFVPPILDFFGY
jgi:diacylglycerol kinase (ATP)